MELRRLLALTRLSAVQAVELGAAVLAAALQGSGPFRVGTDGRVLPGTGRRPVTVPVVAAVLGQVVDAARVPGRRADPAADDLLAELERAVADLPDAGVAAVAGRLADAAAAIDRDAARAELTALVRAVPAGARGGAGPAGASSTAVRSQRTAPREPRNTGRRVTAWLLSVLVLAAVAVVEVVVLGGKISTDIGLLLDAGRGGGTASGAPTSDGPPLRAPAPAAEGSVTGVDLRPLAPCAPGAPCTMRLLVHLAPRADPQVVTWSYQVVDRCTGLTVTAPGGTVTVASNGQQADVVGTVPLPDLPAVAVVAVTGSPAVAASPPVSVGSCRGTG